MTPASNKIIAIIDNKLNGMKHNHIDFEKFLSISI